MKTLKTFLCLSACAAFLVTLATDSFAGDDLICKKADKDAFYDANKDACFTCPKGFSHDRNRGEGADSGGCSRVESRKAVATSGKGPVCIAPSFVSLHDNKPWGVCMKCPHARGRVYDKQGNTIRWSPASDNEYHHDHSKLGTEVGVCHRLRYAAAKKVASGVVSTPAKAAACEAAMASFKAGSALPKFLKVPDVKAAVKAAGLTAEKVKAQLDAYKKDELDDVSDVLTKVKTVSDKFAIVQKELFKDPHIVCDPALAAKKLNELGLVPPGWDEDSYLAFSVVFDLASGVGAQGGYTLVTNFKDPPFVFGVVGATASTNAGYALTAGVQYYPEIDDVKDFLGTGLGASAGIGVGVLGAGVDLSFDTTKAGAAFIQGIGPNVGVGASVSALGFGSVAFSLSNAWDLSTPH